MMSTLHPRRWKRNTRVTLLILSALVIPLQMILAASGATPIGLTVVSDLTPPSVPAGLSASPISSSQIGLSWSASTDNVAVTGYRIRRDGTIVASTSGTTYTDAGLAATTLYSYTVDAYDSMPN